MRLTQASDYALRIVLHLSRKKGEVVEADAISDAEKIPKRFLLKICRDLIKAGIIESSRGKNGGYRLANNPENITMKDVILAVEGTMALTRCQIDPAACNKNATGYCAIHRAFCSVMDVVSKEFEKYDFATLAKMDGN
ncbi:RrF2 family transcriptional regulator [Caldanaerobius polysaccharolyticus]|uniref:RrF2 family transcriptional regulator n=1 Tax=Caldanaerobius polysaccharolyticus TaxID=44256 RepID=UPI00047C9803|nr:Rrf2 family transcriptional regulator [Caldanaerobius polysaccharolyticus]